MSQEPKIESREMENPPAARVDPKLRARVPLLADEPQTLAELFRQAFKKHHRADTLNYKKDGEWHRISADELRERAENIALGL